MANEALETLVKYLSTLSGDEARKLSRIGMKLAGVVPDNVVKLPTTRPGSRPATSTSQPPDNSAPSPEPNEKA